jgi:hypothetical protein
MFRVACCMAQLLATAVDGLALRWPLHWAATAGSLHPNPMARALAGPSLDLHARARARARTRSAACARFSERRGDGSGPPHVAVQAAAQAALLLALASVVYLGALGLAFGNAILSEARLVALLLIVAQVNRAAPVRPVCRYSCVVGADCLWTAGLPQRSRIASSVAPRRAAVLPCPSDGTKSSPKAVPAPCPNRRRPRAVRHQRARSAAPQRSVSVTACR